MSASVLESEFKPDLNLNLSFSLLSNPNSIRVRCQEGVEKWKKLTRRPQGRQQQSLRPLGLGRSSMGGAPALGGPSTLLVRSFRTRPATTAVAGSKT